MSRIHMAFQNKKAFIGFLTAGDPNGEKTIEYILEMERAGADLIEIGIPFSDPTAEGIVIQEANIRALKEGMNCHKVFEIVEKVREKTNIPIVFLTYLNPVYHFGYEDFFRRCMETGVDGIIIPDLPFEEKNEISDYTKKYGIDIITLIAPTSELRIQMLAKEAQGYIYIVSSMGVTGMRSEFQTNLKTIIETVKQVTNTPCAIGFGISTPEQAKEMSSFSDGVIVGSAIVKIIAENGSQAATPLYNYVKSMKDAIKI